MQRCVGRSFVQLLAGLAVLMMAGMNGTKRGLSVEEVVAVVRAAMIVVEDAVPTSADAEALLDAVRDGATAHGGRAPLSWTSTNEHTPEATRGEAAWQEMVWRQAFCSVLSQSTPSDGDGNSLVTPVEMVEFAGSCADAALVEWKKRWQR